MNPAPNPKIPITKEKNSMFNRRNILILVILTGLGAVGMKYRSQIATRWEKGL